MESGLQNEMQIWHYSIECMRLYICERTMCPEIEGTDSAAKMVRDMTNFPGNLHTLT